MQAKFRFNLYLLFIYDIFNISCRNYIQLTTGSIQQNSGKLPHNGKGEFVCKYA